MKKNYERPAVTVITVEETNWLLSGSGKKSTKLDTDWKDDGSIDANTTGQQSDENHTGTSDGQNNMFGY
jgi:uncharacterized lipoprotein